MEHIWKFKKKATYISHEQLALAKRYVLDRKLAFAETLARTIFDDIARGEWGGTFYMDGRALNPAEGDFYAVGGALDNSELKLDEYEIKDEGDVKAAIELLREAIVQLQSDSDDPVGIGFWFDNGYWYFDVSNIIDGKESAMQLARHRGELAIYSFSTNESIRCATIGHGRINGCAWASYNHIRKNR